jgi:muramoyltetrapeptide carboxypeptidase
MPTQPPYLKKGDTILLIATARKVSREEMAPAIAIMRGWGLKVEEGPHLYSSDNQFAGSDEERASDLQWALDHPTAKAFIIARGGYGTMRIMDRVNFEGFKKFPKWAIGYSDVTVLHNYLYNIGYCSLHATMPINFTKDEGATDSLRKSLFGETVSWNVPVSTYNRRGSAEAELVGGNLSMLYAISGSPSDINLAGKILLIEDLDEYLYHLDRMMYQLKRAGKLGKLKGMIIGGMNDMRDNPIPFGKTPEQIISEVVSEYNFPVCFNFPSGHIVENYAFCHGRKIRMKIEADHVSIEYT